MSLGLNDSVTSLSGVGAKRGELYKKLGITTIGQLITFYPRSYLDLSRPVPIEETILNENNVIKATVVKKTNGVRFKGRMTIFKLVVSDDESTMAITIFNSKYLFDSLAIGKSYYLYGKVTGSALKREMTMPLFISTDEESLIRPIYHLTEGLSNTMLQTNMKEALEHWGDCLFDSLPDSLRREQELCILRFAIENIHFPTDSNALAIAKKRLVLEELLVLRLGLLMLRQKNRVKTNISLPKNSAQALIPFLNRLPFSLTRGQHTAIEEALFDMQKDIPMNRLLQGDVGSGKTMVAAALCYACAKSGHQSAVMAPTQILAAQHFKTFADLLAPLGIRIALLTGTTSSAQKRELCQRLLKGEIDVLVGTHALMGEDIAYPSLGLVVTDEQHRFGVAQRAAVAQKGENPHLLVMSATPIPRTLALLIYGDLDVSLIKELPKGRQPIDTLVIDSKKRGRALGFLKKQLDEGRQAYIVCPLIDESENDLISINAYLNALKKTPLASYCMEALSGKVKGAQKDEIMRRFSENEIKLLVSTTVVEVGIDVPNATVMMIENAERFGLSQLHQLRGRVGRGEHKSYCILVSDNEGEDNKKRLEIMKNNSDGFVIAEEDLKLRGPGDFFGLRQHGLPTLKLASYYDDMDLLKAAKRLAKKILADDPTLLKEENKGLKQKADELFEQNGQSSMN